MAQAAKLSPVVRKAAKAVDRAIVASMPVIDKALTLAENALKKAKAKGTEKPKAKARPKATRAAKPKAAATKAMPKSAPKSKTAPKAKAVATAKAAPKARPARGSGKGR